MFIRHMTKKRMKVRLMHIERKKKKKEKHGKKNQGKRDGERGGRRGAKGLSHQLMDLMT